MPETTTTFTTDDIASAATALDALIAMDPAVMEDGGEEFGDWPMRQYDAVIVEPWRDALEERAPALLALARAAVAERTAWEPGGGRTLAAREAKEVALDALIAALDGGEGVDDGE